jgi:hypothetical protein
MVQMVRVNVSITNVSAERFWHTHKPIPPIKINTNLNLVEMEKKQEDSLEVPFVLTINYNPSIAQMSLRGKAFVKGKKDEIARIHEGYKKKKPPPKVVVQSISNVVFIESVLISRTLNIPPPIPLPQIPPKKISKEDSSRLDYTA